MLFVTFSLCCSFYIVLLHLRVELPESALQVSTLQAKITSEFHWRLTILLLLHKSNPDSFPAVVNLIRLSWVDLWIKVLLSQIYTLLT